MSYNTAYKSSFQSLAGVLWELDIKIQGYNSLPVVISLDGDQPIVIEWKETKLSDAVCPSLCTIKVVNEKDRQMLSLMDGRDALCSVYRNKLLYWRGLLDDCVYEEPYSYRDSYITEITFSDFGILNRIDFQPSGIKSLMDIVSGCLEASSLDRLVLIQAGSLMLGAIPATLERLYVNTDRFEGKTMHETLDSVLRALSLRIIQKAGSILIYDIENLVENYPIGLIAWKGTDAFLSGSEVFGRFELEFDRDAEPVIADGTMDPEQSNWAGEDRYFVDYCDENSVLVKLGFNIDINRFYGENTNPPTLMHNDARYFRTKRGLTDCNAAGVAYRICCFPIGSNQMRNLLANTTPWFHNNAEALFHVGSRLLPSVSDKSQYEIRVCVKLLFSILQNPFESPEGQGVDIRKRWDKWKDRFQKIYIPVKLELLDDNGHVVMHYTNAQVKQNQPPGFLCPIRFEERGWHNGPADWSDMVLAYYNDEFDGNPLGNKWSENRMALDDKWSHVPAGYGIRKDGEYIPLPPSTGRLRLTVSNAVVKDFDSDGDPQDYNLHIYWQLYSDPSITVVKANAADDSIDEEGIVEKDYFSPYTDMYSETLSIGGYKENHTTPADFGILMDGSGNAVGDFTKNGIVETLLKHRLNSLTDQLGDVHPTLSGTAEITAAFGLLSDPLMKGVFLPVASLQNLVEDTEKLTMMRVSAGRERYSAQWSLPVCALEEESYNIAWSSPVCVHPPEHYSFAWSLPICARHQITIGPIWETIE